MLNLVFFFCFANVNSVWRLNSQIVNMIYSCYRNKYRKKCYENVLKVPIYVTCFLAETNYCWMFYKFSVEFAINVFKKNWQSLLWQNGGKIVAKFYKKMYFEEIVSLSNFLILLEVVVHSVKVNKLVVINMSLFFKLRLRTTCFLKILK